jgi:hypothetical protein
VSGAIRIVFDLSDASGHAVFIALEVDDSIKALMTAATTTHRNTAVVIAT